MKSPNWREEELMLTLDLYLDRDQAWHSKISNSTWEVIALSQILRGMDWVGELPNDTYRSTNSIRLKLANLKAVDDRFTKPAMANVGNSDKAIWLSYSKKPDELHALCKVIIEQHYKGKRDNYVLEYIKRFENVNLGKNRINEYVNTIIEVTKLLRVEAANLDDLDFAQSIIESCFDISREIEPYAEKKEIKKQEDAYKVHAGVNQKCIKSENKIGQHVQNVIKELGRKGLISSKDIERLSDAEWCRKHLHLGHSFFIRVNPQMESKEQRTDIYGHQRYWKDVFVINDDEYYLCKEWYENQRKYFDSWVQSLYVHVSMDIFEKTLSDIKKVDENKVSINVEEFVAGKQNEKEIRSIICYLLEKGVLSKFQDTDREVLVDDYDMLFQMINRPEKYIGD